MAGKLEKSVVSSIIAPELIYWGKVNIKKIFLLERENRERDFNWAKDAEIIRNYRELAEREKKCIIVRNNDGLEEAVNKIYDNILGE